MKTLKHVLFSFCILSGVLSGCKKYPDGPLLSLRTKEHRLVGTWDVESYTVDGNDSTAYLKSQPFYGTYKFHQGDYGVGDFVFKSNNGLAISGGHWYFKNNKKDLQINLAAHAGGPFNMGPYAAETAIWEIRRLKEDELWLKTNYNGKNYFVKFKQ